MKNDVFASEEELMEEAKTGCPEAQYSLGCYYEDYSRYAEAKQWYELSAAQDYAPAHYNLGGLYERALGVKQNYKKAHDYYLAAEKDGFNPARLALARIYLTGEEGIEQDIAKAVQYVQDSADDGDIDGMLMLGGLYENGMGVPQNNDMAMAYYKGAQAMGCESASINIQCLENKLAAAASGELPDWMSGYIESANNGDAMSQYSIGSFYYMGTVIPQDYEKAIEWFSKAAEQNNDYALYFLGECYKNGTGVAQDLAKAKEYYAKSVALGNEAAKAALESL